jgi:GntR family transcriptional regulator
MPVKNQDTLYDQVYHTIVSQIRDGSLANGSKLPTERAMCDLYQVSRMTIRQALACLERDGYISRRQGKGTFVQAGRIEQRLNRLYRLRDAFSGKGMRQEQRIMSWGLCQADGLVAENMRLSDRAPIYRLVRMILADGKPLAVETSYLPAALFKREPSLDSLAHTGLYATLDQYGLSPTRATEKLRAVQTDKETAVLLQRPQSDPFLQVTRLSEANGIIVEYTISIIRSDLFEYSIELLSET